MLRIVASVAVLLLAGAGWLVWSGKLGGAGSNDMAMAPGGGAKSTGGEATSADAKGGETKAARKGGGGGGQQVAVETAPAASADTTTDLRAIGSLQSDESVQISSEIAGRVTEMPFAEGGPVKEGDVIVRLDDALVRAEVSDMQARYEFATSNLGRANTLAKSGNVTERARDEATANAETARSALELAKVRLAKHEIRAPFPGVVGIRTVSPGAYVGVGQPIVNLEKIDTLKVDFSLPELFLAQVKTGQDVEVTVDAIPGRTFTGTVYAIDPHVDVNGRSLKIRARLPNPEGLLRPGLFARILVKGPTKRNVLLVPESAIVPRGQDKIVFRVANGQAMEAKVTLGNRSNGQVEVLDGLEPDSVVVTAGQQKLKDGSPVDVVSNGEPARRKGT